MNERQTIDQNRYIIAVFEIALILLILIDDLQIVVMNILLIDQFDVFCRAFTTRFACFTVIRLALDQVLDIIFLYLPGLLLDLAGFIGIGNVLCLHFYGHSISNQGPNAI